MTILILMKIAESSPDGKKTQWEKEKLLIMSNFFFSHSVFKRLVLQTRKNQGLPGRGLKTLWSNFWTIFFFPNDSVFNPFPNEKFRLFKIESVCRRQFQIWWEWQKVPQMGRKHCGKRKNCLLRAISPFSTVFSKDSYCRHVKTRACLGKG